MAATPGERREFDVLPVLAGIALRCGDPEAATLARGIAVKLEASSGAPGILMAAARCRTIVDRDRSAASRALELARSTPRKMLAAGAFEDAAELLPRDDAVGVLNEAAEIYARLGARRDHARAVARLKGLGARAPSTGRRPRAVFGWEALTSAELEVVQLAARGMTNRQIGGELFVSHRTVATHLSHVFDKLGLRSRVELAHEAARRLGSGD